MLPVLVLAWAPHLCACPLPGAPTPETAPPAAAGCERHHRTAAAHPSPEAPATDHRGHDGDPLPAPSCCAASPVIASAAGTGATDLTTGLAALPSLDAFVERPLAPVAFALHAPESAHSPPLYLRHAALLI